MKTIFYLTLTVLFLIITSCNHSQFIKDESFKLNTYYSLIPNGVDGDVNDIIAANEYDENGYLIQRLSQLPGEVVHHPVATAQFGIMLYENLIISYSNLTYQVVSNQVDFFKKSYVDHESIGYGFPYLFDYGIYPAPWYSGMAQGEIISFLIRWYDFTKDTTVLDIIHNTYKFMITLENEGGCLSLTPEGYSWIEEYPRTGYNHVLNGFLFSLISVYEYANYFRNQEAIALYNQLAWGLRMVVSEYEEENWLLYDRSTNQFVTDSYMYFQALQMKQLYEYTKDQFYRDKYELWLLFYDSGRPE